MDHGASFGKSPKLFILLQTNQVSIHVTKKNLSVTKSYQSQQIIEGFFFKHISLSPKSWTSHNFVHKIIFCHPHWSLALVNFHHPSGLICEVTIPFAILKTHLNKQRFKQLDPFIYIYIYTNIYIYIYIIHTYIYIYWLVVDLPL